ncbi:MAG: citrate/2-methylcitrate synthase, partial [Thermoleophilia bacterium]
MSEVRRGLAGVVADTTAISEQDGAASVLTYRGYPVQDLARRCSYEQVAYLLLHGELPTPGELAGFCERERKLRELSPTEWDVLGACNEGAHPLDTLRTVISAAGGEYEATVGEEDGGLDTAIGLIAKTPTILAHDAWRRDGEPPVPPDPARGLAENLLWMYFGEEPDARIVRALETALILYAELGFNASTFTVRTVMSTGADLHGAAVAALAALRGPLHGGANEEVWRTMSSLGDPARAAEWLEGEVAAGRRVTGFGHRVFRLRDPRAEPMREALGAVAALRDGDTELAMHDALVGAMAASKGIPPNVDLAAGPAFHLMGFPTEMFTP